MTDDPLYRDEILDHYFSSEYRGRLECPHLSASGNNPLCGDHICLDLRLGDDGKIAEIGFDGEGCAISQAGASLLAETLEGRSLEEASKFSSDDMLKVLRLPLTPARRKCGLLAWRVLQKAIAEGGSAAGADSCHDAPSPVC